MQLEVPRHNRSHWRFFLRVFLAVTVGAGSAMALAGEWRLAVVGVVIEGLLFAHMLELVHSCIHGTAFGAPDWIVSQASCWGCRCSCHSPITATIIWSITARWQIREEGLLWL